MGVEDDGGDGGMGICMWIWVFALGCGFEVRSEFKTEGRGG